MIDQIFEAPTRYYTNRESRRHNERHQVKVMPLNMVLERTTPFQIKEVWGLLLGTRAGAR